VVVTRPADQAGPWVASLRQAGIDAVALPLLGIAPADDPRPVDMAWQTLADQALIVFVSPNAATQFFARRPPGTGWPAALRAASPGPGTSEVLRGLGVPPGALIEPSPDAAQFDSEALWQQLGRLPWPGRRVTIVRGEGGREWLADQLVAAGAEVGFVCAYRRGPPQLDEVQRARLRQAVAEPQRHLWMFSSSEAIDQLGAAAGLDVTGLRHALRQATAIATHPRIAERARAAGFTSVWPCRPELPAVVACIQSSGPPRPLGAPHTAP
jgi:uroporphyrinogen-III synthase